MTTAPARSPRLLVILTLLLVVTGGTLLAMPRPASTPSPGTAAPTRHPSATARDQRTAQGPRLTRLAPTERADPSALPPRGEGPAGDKAIQKSLEAAWPPDLAATDERRLLAAGRHLLRADATGIGRNGWPALFGSPGQTIAPAFATARFRIQAAVARRDNSPDKAVVHLVWAGTDRGGTHTDRRVTDWHFTRTSTKGATSWTPQPR
ncbi:hypothetical protein AB0F07_40360 [Streptomyces fructofermentans]|uniref:hypothetical protein n=1 Tax=Streptomyces fructofermentans TaxID=152141 RepID=UPI0033F634DA